MAPDDARPVNEGRTPDHKAARAAEDAPPDVTLDAAIEVFRRTAARAIAVAGDPRALPMTVTETRHQATFALAAVGAAFKGALRAARPNDPNV